MHAAAGLALFFLPATAAAASPPATSVLSLAEAEALEVKIGADAELARRRLQTGDEGLLPGPDLEAVNDGQDPLNEPCYTHNGQCEGYVVCCVTRGTCGGFGGLISSNANYYEGGCADLEGSSASAWDNAACTEQGECHVPYLEQVKGGTAQAGLMTDVPNDVMLRLSETGTPSGTGGGGGGGGGGHGHGGGRGGGHGGGGGGTGGGGSGGGAGSCYDMTGAIAGNAHACICTADVCANGGAACTAGGGIWTPSCVEHCACPAAGADGAACEGDVDASGNVDVNDLLALLSSYGQSGAEITNPGADLDGSGGVDVNDLLSLLGQFGSTCGGDDAPPACALGEDCGGQIMNQCGTSCPNVCGTPAAAFCNRMCAVGYQCPGALWFDEQNGECVEEANCP